MPGRIKVREEKIKALDEVKKLADESTSVIFTNYRGMTVKQITNLRRSLRPSGAVYKVVKNTLSMRALPKLKDQSKGSIG